MRVCFVRRQRKRYYFKWTQSKFRQRKNFSSFSLFTFSRKTSHREISCLSRAAMARKCRVEKKCRVMVCPWNPLFEFSDFETNRMDISSLLMAIYIITLKKMKKCCAKGKVSVVHKTCVIVQVTVKSTKFGRGIILDKTSSSKLNTSSFKAMELIICKMAKT